MMLVYVGSEMHVRLPSLVDLPNSLPSNISFDKHKGTFTPIKKSDNYFHAKRCYVLICCIVLRSEYD